jgi:beta-glucosidase
VLWVNETKRFNALQKIAVEESRLKIPLLFGLDVIHGYRTIFPIPIGMASSWDPSVPERAAEIAAREARAAGVHWTFAPMVDVARDARWGRIAEGAGEDPYLGARWRRPGARLPGAVPRRSDRLLACAKHFAAYGKADGGRDYDPVYVSETELRNVYFPPFAPPARAGVGSFMSAYMDLNDVPAGANPWLLRDVLRGEWGFSGFVVSDAFGTANLVTQHFARDGRDAAARALGAGSTWTWRAAPSRRTWPRSSRTAPSSRRRWTRPCGASSRSRCGWGCSSSRTRTKRARPSVLADPKSRAESRRLAQRSMVLLKNEKQLLPLKASLAERRGDRAARRLEGRHRGLLDGVRPRAGGGDRARGPARPARAPRRSRTRPGPEIRREVPSFFDDFVPGPKPPKQTPEAAEAAFRQAVETAKGAELVIAVMGERADMSGEAASRASLELPGRQQELLKAIVALGKPVVLVLMGGRPLALEWEAANVPAILEAWQPGAKADTRWPTCSSATSTRAASCRPPSRAAAARPRSTTRTRPPTSRRLADVPLALLGGTDGAALSVRPRAELHQLRVLEPELGAPQVKLGVAAPCRST